MKKYKYLILLLLVGLCRSYATDQSNGSDFSDMNLGEESLRKETVELQVNIKQLLQEVKDNKLNSVELASLSTTAEALNSLDTQGIQKIIDALDRASNAPDDKTRKAALVEAYQAQNEVMTKLKDLAQEINNKEFTNDMRVKLRDFIIRQSTNIRVTGALVAGGRNLQQLIPAEITQHDLLVIDQKNLSGDIDLLCKALSAAPEDSDPNSATPAVQQALAEAKLTDLTQPASDLVASGPFTDALTKETAVRTGLTSLLRASMSGLDAVTRLEELRQQIGDLIADEKDLGESSGVKGSVLSDRQARATDDASLAQAMLQPVSEETADMVGKAQSDMADLVPNLVLDTEHSAKLSSIIDTLTQASDLLDKKVAEAEAEQDSSPVAKMEELEKLKTEVDQAKNNPQESTADLQKLQEQASTPSPQAAEKIAQAASDLQPDPATANKLLSQASDAIQKQEDALRPTADAYQALANVQNQINQANQETNSANQEVQNKSSMAQGYFDLNNAQKTVSAAEQNAPANVQPQLQAAAQDLQNAANQALQSQGDAAQAQGKQAQAALQNAQNALGQAMAQIQAQGSGKGQGPGLGGVGSTPMDTNGALNGMGGDGVTQVMGNIKPKDREAIVQMQAVKYPAQYSAQVQQYFKDLSSSDQ